MILGAYTLIFDDGPDLEWTPRVLAELRRCRTHASFFLTGEQLSSTPWLAREMRMMGHDVELHCHRHIRHTELSELELERDTTTALRTFARAGIHPTRWHTPWGIRTQATERVARRHNLELVDCSLDTHDARGDASSVMLERAASALHAEAIVLMHDAIGPGARRDSCEQTVSLIASLLEAAHARGLRAVSLSELDQLRSVSLTSIIPADPVIAA